MFHAHSIYGRRGHIPLLRETGSVAFSQLPLLLVSILQTSQGALKVDCAGKLSREVGGHRRLKPPLCIGLIYISGKETRR